MQAQEKRNIIRKPKGEKMDIKKRYMHGELAPDAPKAPTSKFLKKKSRLEELNKLMKNKVYGETDLLK